MKALLNNINSVWEWAMNSGDESDIFAIVTVEGKNTR